MKHRLLPLLLVFALTNLALAHLSREFALSAHLRSSLIHSARNQSARHVVEQVSPPAPDLVENSAPVFCLAIEVERTPRGQHRLASVPPPVVQPYRLHCRTASRIPDDPAHAFLA